MQVSRWANGLGETRELAAYRTTDGALVWRLSIATIAAASDFSALSGVDRRLMNLGDGPLSLVVGDDPVTVPRREVVSFRGEDAVRALHANGYDLNVMTGRGRATSSLETVSVDGSVTFAAGASTMLTIVVLDGKTAVRTGDHAFHLPPLDSLVAALGDDVTVDGDATVAVVRIAMT
nr:HutD family protein [Allobranchiibius sp. GilTou38]